MKSREKKDKVIYIEVTEEEQDLFYKAVAAQAKKNNNTYSASSYGRAILIRWARKILNNSAK